jgi:hypothetical protein
MGMDIAEYATRLRVGAEIDRIEPSVAVKQPHKLSPCISGRPEHRHT